MVSALSERLLTSHTHFLAGILTNHCRRDRTASPRNLLSNMDALSPRDANAMRPARAESKAPAQPKAAKDKEHPPPPPNNVTEPSSIDRREGAVYQIGKLLGKGGFAICYEGKLAGTSKRYALKIVKCQMPSKMEQKVRIARPGSLRSIADLMHLVPNRAANPFQDAPTKHCSVPPRLHI